MAKRSTEIPESVHHWLDFALDQASKDVVQNDERLVCYLSRYASGRDLQTMITYAVEEGIFGARRYLVFAVFDVTDEGQANRLHMTDELRISERDGGMVLGMKVMAKATAMTRAIADVLAYGEGLSFRRTGPVVRTA